MIQATCLPHVGLEVDCMALMVRMTRTNPRIWVMFRAPLRLPRREAATSSPHHMPPPGNELLMIGSRILAMVCLLAGGTALPVSAEPVDLELVLAADGSGSIDDGEMRLQRDGYARALTDPELVSAL